MENKLTIEQALNNLALVVETQFKGTRAEHIALEKSLELISKSLCKCPPKEALIPPEENISK